jgi:type I restriction enzyme S subunit
VYEFLYFRMMALDFDALNRGSTQPLLTQSDLSTQRFAIPSRAVLNKFHEHASGYFLKIDHIMNESRTLAALRDALLPKLIRGEIRLKDAERFLKERGL